MTDLLVESGGLDCRRAPGRIVTTVGRHDGGRVSTFLNDFAHAGMVVGIGTTGHTASLVSSGIVEAGEIDAIQELGGAGELLGHFFDDAGRLLATTLTARTLAASFGDPERQRLVAVARLRLLCRELARTEPGAEVVLLDPRGAGLQRIHDDDAMLVRRYCAGAAQ